jgi:hypothetical protein
VIGEESRFWRVETVLWTQTPDAATFDSFASAIASRATSIDGTHPGVHDLEPASSYVIRRFCDEAGALPPDHPGLRHPQAG